MRFMVPVAAALALVGCAPDIPDSNAGVGFRSYDEYLKEQAAREAALRGSYQTVVPPERTAANTPDPADSTEAIVRDANAAIEAGTTAEVTPAPAPVDPVADARARAAISDEQDFDAVADRETIESDASRIAANRQQYRVIQPTDLPTRPGNLGPNIVDFALATNNPVGEQLYSRSRVFAESRFNRNCAAYPSSDVAQQEFLAKGGPERDRLGLDPDGDGFACYWDPAPFRAARR